MTVAAADIVIVVIGVLAVGFLGFFAVVAAMVVRFITFVLRPVLHLGSRHVEPDSPAHGPTVRSCPNMHCGYLNPADARYCARCGQALDAVVRPEHHG